jgi:cytochrome c556
MSYVRASILHAAVVVAGLAGFAAAAPAADNTQVLKDRQATMKQQAKDLGAIKAYLTGKTDEAAAATAATSLTQTMAKIPSLFPPGSGAASPDGKYQPKPAVWTNWDEFLAARKNAAAKVDVLFAAIKGGDKPAIQAAFVDLGKHGCGGCHEKFRQTLKP